MSVTLICSFLSGKNSTSGLGQGVNAEEKQSPNVLKRVDLHAPGFAQNRDLKD